MTAAVTPLAIPIALSVATGLMAGMTAYALKQPQGNAISIVIFVAK